MRHGRKSRSVLFDGYKRHVLRDLDTGLVPAVGITPANVPEASVTGDIAADLEAAGWQPGRAAHRPGLPVLGPGPRPRPGPGHLLQGLAGPQHRRPVRQGPVHPRLRRRAADLPRRGEPCRSSPARPCRFPKDTCAACPLRARCTTSSTGRSVSIHPDEALLAELRQRQQTPEGRAKLRERVQVEHALAHVGHWQGRRARYLRHPQEPVRPAPRRRRPQPPRHRPPARHRQLPARRLTATCAVVVAAWRTKILRLVRSAEYPRTGFPSAVALGIAGLPRGGPYRIHERLQARIWVTQHPDHRFAFPAWR